MVKNAFTDIIFGWERMTTSQKVERLQALENMIARFQNWKARRIITKKNNQFVKKHIGEYRDPSAYYIREDKDYIYIHNIDVMKIEAIKNIIHEGFHAYIHDFVSGAVSGLKLYSQMNLEKFYIEEEQLPAIRNEFESRRMMPLFDSYYIEERVNYQEDTIYMIKMILDAIETPYDAECLSNTLILALDYAYENEKRGKTYESRYGVSYDDVVIDALNKGCEETYQVNKNGKIIQMHEPELMRFVERALRYYGEYSNADSSLLVSPEMAKEIKRKATENIKITFREYVMKMLREKKKS